MMNSRLSCLTLALLVLSASSAVATTAAIPEDEKVSRADMIVVATVANVTTSRVFYCWNDPTNILVVHTEELPAKGVRPTEGKAPNLGEFLCTCNVEDVLKGAPTGTTVTVTYRYPLMEPFMIPWPTELVMGKKYILWLTATNQTLTMIDRRQGARLVAERYVESRKLVNDQFVETWVSHTDYLQRIKDLVRREAGTTTKSTVRATARP